MPTYRILAALLATTGAICAQDATFSTDVKVVNLFATVRDRDGKIVKDLTKDDFVVKENGRVQPIRYFTQESNLPLILGLLVDTSRSMQTVFEPETIASNKFFEQVLREDRDLAFVMHFDNKVGVLQEFTSSKEKLAEALEKLKIPRIPSTLLYDAVRDASANQMKAQNGRKAFIVLSDGLDVRSKATLATAIEYAQRADTMIYSILFAHRGMGAGRGGRGINISIGPRGQNGPKVMERLARETGGAYAKVTDDDPIEKIYARIEDELRSQYSIGYTPGKGDDKGFRKIVLTVKRKGLVVRTREGYYPR